MDDVQKFGSDLDAMVTHALDEVAAQSKRKAEALDMMVSLVHEARVADAAFMSRLEDSVARLRGAPQVPEQIQAHERPDRAQQIAAQRWADEVEDWPEQPEPVPQYVEQREVVRGPPDYSLRGLLDKATEDNRQHPFQQPRYSPNPQGYRRG